ncbi:MAG: Bacterial regulatory protein lacI family [Actinomycetia bacterium]|nr:Bacterial regulatory protein lacI family [Actinomycetes bacterium]
MADIKDVAARAGVSVATVSRVLNGNPGRTTTSAPSSSSGWTGC